MGKHCLSAEKQLCLADEDWGLNLKAQFKEGARGERGQGCKKVRGASTRLAAQGALHEADDLMIS